MGQRARARSVGRTRENRFSVLRLLRIFAAISSRLSSLEKDNRERGRKKARGAMTADGVQDRGYGSRLKAAPTCRRADGAGALRSARERAGPHRSRAAEAPLSTANFQVSADFVGIEIPRATFVIRIAGHSVLVSRSSDVVYRAHCDAQRRLEWRNR